MKKVAFVFVIAVLLPSLVLAWLAVRSLRDQQFLLERQQSLIDQHATDALAQNISDQLAQRQQEFAAQVESLAAAGDARTLAAQFDNQLRRRWPLADIGFCVTAAGKILSPLPNARTEAQMFRLDNSGFLGNREPVEVYWNANNGAVGNASGANAVANNTLNNFRNLANQSSIALNNVIANSAAQAPQQPRQQLRTIEPAATPNAAPPSGQNANLAVNTFSNVNFGGPNGGNAGANNTLNNSRNQGNQALFTLNNASTDFTAQTTQQQRQQFTVPEPPASANIIAPTSQNTALAANNIRNGGFGGGGGFGSGGRGGRGEGGANIAGRDASALSDRAANGLAATSITPSQQEPSQRFMLSPAKELDAQAAVAQPQAQQAPAIGETVANNDAADQQLVQQAQNVVNYKAAQARKVDPQNSYYQMAENPGTTLNEPRQNLSKAVPAEAEFRQLIGNQNDGMLARFLQNKLKLMFWHRLSTEPDLIFGAQLNLKSVVDGLRALIQSDPALQNDICIALLDDNAKPVAMSRANFQANWKRPFVATEIGDALPHWEVAAYLVNPAALTQAAHTAKLTLGLFIALLVLAIGIGSWLIVSSLNAELKLARQKTDFVSNVSHELKTPLTSIRMFSELLAEGRVADASKQHSYLQIITAEAGRLTRLINNVLDFSRMERGEKKYNFQPCDLTGVVRGIERSFRPHLEAGGFNFACELPDAPISVRGDADALSQVIVNLLSNAEKYSNGSVSTPSNVARATRLHSERASLGDSPASPTAAGGTPAPRSSSGGGEGEKSRKEIALQLAQRQSPLPHAEIKVLDRGEGIPRGSEEKIFEKFYRAHDSLSSGIQGSGLGLTIARQIARAHGGDVVYEPRVGGGSCFILRLPIQTTDQNR
jgi:signal transduction histidine kinase